MDNAVKALLIAASVMVAMLIISLGISIYNSNAGVAEDATSSLESAAAAAFNQRFSNYVTDSTTGSTAKTLVNKVLQHNMSVDSSTFSPGDHHILLNLYPKTGTASTHKWKVTSLKQMYNNISNGKKYKIYITNCDNYPGGYYNGYIVCMTIKEL